MFGAGEPELRALEPEWMARASAVRAVIDPVRLRQLVEDLPAPRVRTQQPEVMAAVDGLVLDAFRSVGWQAQLRGFERRPAWRWADISRRRVVVPTAALPGVNVVATKHGASTEAVVVVAHSDTVPGSGGADDNGSGVVAVMELARLLAPLRLHRTVVLATVDHEELGFIGSRQLVRELVAERRVAAAVVFEMLGYTSREPESQRLPPGIGAIYPGQVRRIRANGRRGDFLAVIYRRADRSLAICFAECLAHLTSCGAVVLLRAPISLPLLGPLLLRMVPLARGFARSDHVSFWTAGLPALQVTDTAKFRNPHYHRPTDTPETLDYDRLADVIAATALAVQRMAHRS